MSADTLSRPLAKRVSGLSAPRVSTESAPDIPENVIQAAVDALQRGETHYTDRPGILPLRQWIADDLVKRFDIPMTAKDVTITCGATEARFVSVKLLAKAGTEILCVDDGLIIEDAAHLVGAKTIYSSYDLMKVSVLYLSSHAPTLLNVAVNGGWWVIWDMATKRGSPADFHPAQNPELAPKVVTIGSVSDVMPGWRVGWMAGSQVAEKLRAFKQSMTICSTNVSQWAALEMVQP